MGGPTHLRSLGLGLCPNFLCEENIGMEKEFCVEEDLSQGQSAEFWELLENTSFSN